MQKLVKSDPVRNRRDPVADGHGANAIDDRRENRRPFAVQRASLCFLLQRVLMLSTRTREHFRHRFGGQQRRSTRLLLASASFLLQARRPMARQFGASVLLGALHARDLRKSMAPIIASRRGQPWGQPDRRGSARVVIRMVGCPSSIASEWPGLATLPGVRSWPHLDADGTVRRRATRRNVYSGPDVAMPQVRAPSSSPTLTSSRSPFMPTSHRPFGAPAGARLAGRRSSTTNPPRQIHP